jgi:putative DNA primase/helicase
MTQTQYHDATALAEALAQRCGQATPQGESWQACCPAHDDTHPSLSITARGDKVLLHCYAGCAPGAIVAALGLTLGDLFVEHSSPNGHKRILQVYPYVDAHGYVVHETVRYEPKAFTQRRPDPAQPGNYIWSLKGIEPVLYHLPAVLAAIAQGDLVHLAEGEKDAETLIALGLVATTVPMGATYWRDSYTRTLTGAHVVVWPDNDEAGQASVTKVSRHLSGKAQTLRIARVPTPHKDVTDWIAAGGTPAEVEALVQAATPPPPVSDTSGPTSTGKEPPLPYSDYTNALAFVRDHGQVLRYCYAWKSWLVWTGTHWQRDEIGQVHQLAKQTVKRLARQAEGLDDAEAKALLAHIKKSLSKSSLDAMVRTAQDEPGIPIKPDTVDVDPWVLNCLNGTLDLRTGTLRPQQQTDLLTKCLTIPYESQAPAPTWKAFLWRIMGGSQGDDSPDMSPGELEARHTADSCARTLVDFLQQAIGYTLTGSTREQCLFLLQGLTKTGKSTLLATLRKLLGPYAQQADMESFMHKDRPEVRNDLADLAGSRFVCALEGQQGRRLAESLVKQMTGGADLMKARFLFQEHFTFKPQFKIFLGTNHLPVITDTDSAIWERIHRVPFTVQIPPEERDKMLEERLQGELAGILAWAVQGCLAWQRLGGLRVPAAVQASNAAYRQEMDNVGRFLDACCLVDPSVRVKMGELYSAYKTWCESIGETAVSLTVMGKRLDEKGVEKRSSNIVWRIGLGLKDQKVP